jgi:hypothetical protein
VNLNSQSNDLSTVLLANMEALAQESETPRYSCPDGSSECVRVTRGNTVHIYYKD